MDNIWLIAIYTNYRRQDMLRQAKRERFAQGVTPGFAGSTSSLSSLCKWLGRLWKKHPALSQPHKVSSMLER
ncbi:MAG: hypothetical protein WBB55_05065 [Anaerolineales bacterium]